MTIPELAAALMGRAEATAGVRISDRELAEGYFLALATSIKSKEKSCR